MSNRGGKNRPTEEEIAEKRRQRAEKKKIEEEKKQQALQNGTSEGSIDGLFVQRKWIGVRREEGSNEGVFKVRILSWNILAQGLVRRKLFPGSDCLKWKEREAGLCAEMRSHDWDIAAFQEVDKVEVHGPNLEKINRRYIYAKGYSSKQHGLMIAWRVKSNKSKLSTNQSTFDKDAAGSKIIYLDREVIGENGSTRSGLSRVTRNVALFVALTSSNDPSKGLIIATTHLFWHPMHAYERVRQSGILKRALVKWRKENAAWTEWPIILAGDFNDQPHSATYKLMIGEALTKHNWQEIKSSAVVHKSVDEAHEDEDEAEDQNEKSVDEDEEGGEEDDNKGEDSDDDHMLKNCRRATPQDGLLSLADLIQLHDLEQDMPQDTQRWVEDDETNLIGTASKSGLTSAYGSYYGQLIDDQDGNYFGSKSRGRERFDDPHWTPNTLSPHIGTCTEPMWTLHSTIFALTLDYIFLFPSIPAVTSLLPTHRTEVLAPGVPRKRVCASDHVAIGAEIEMHL